MDPSRVSEIVDLIHVAVGLRLVGLVIARPGQDSGSEIEAAVLVVLDEELPAGPAERRQWLERRMSVGSLENIEVTLMTVEEFATVPPARLSTFAWGRLMFDGSGRITPRLTDARLAPESAGPDRRPL